MSITTISTVGMSREDWLKHRRSGIGGSDAAATLGLNAYKSPFAVWADKLGQLPDQEDNEAMRQGRDLEDYVAQRFAEQTGKKCRRYNAIIRNDAYPFALANIDRAVVGEKAGLECKTTSLMNLKRYKAGEYPDNYYVQCMHYLAVTGWDKWYLAVLVLGSGFYVFEIERDEGEINALMEAERACWDDHVVTQQPPAVDGSRSTAKAINAMAIDSTDEAEIHESKASLTELEAITGQIRFLAKRAETIRQDIKVKMGGATSARCDEYQAFWRESQRIYIDKAALLQHCPKSIIAKVAKVRKCRCFYIRKDTGYATD